MDCLGKSLTFVLIVLFLTSLISLPLVNSQSQIQQIIIASDGSIIGTDSIRQNGNVFTLTKNLLIPITIEKDNIVLDGQGFTLQGSGINPIGQRAQAAAINLTCTNVTVTNFHISGWQAGILGVFDNNVIAGNNFTNNAFDVAIYANNYRVTGNYIGSGRIVGNNNVISQNIITLGDYASGFWISSSSGTIIEANDVTMTKETTTFISTDNGNFEVYHNNFLNVEVNTGGAFLLIITYPPNIVFPPWDNGYPSGGNYWSDYSIRYPNSTEIDSSGIGNTPYVSSTAGPDVTDNYPLMAPYNFSKPIILSQPNQSPSPSLSPSPSIPEFSVLAILTMFLSVLFVAVIIRHRKTANSALAEKHKPKFRRKA